ncbi:hCG2029388, isoform CRA_c [Homo sapiens]|uniref:Putative uncharacterized protein FAM30A n=1 Tax=Homo sapiens TaxID=9606 RepID=FA30A_HUMAN|nr:RecName: Full=Putative uncharacterized protein FAM30A [Homo sapiens]EAW81954.1 hCG2029388, isoform CRA_c [Homo sapiens]
MGTLQGAALRSRERPSWPQETHGHRERTEEGCAVAAFSADALRTGGQELEQTGLRPKAGAPPMPDLLGHRICTDIGKGWRMDGGRTCSCSSFCRCPERGARRSSPDAPGLALDFPLLLDLLWHLCSWTSQPLEL